MAMPSLVIPSHHTSLAQQLGGNARAREFFQGHPDYSSTMSLSEKYNSEFAAQYREKATTDRKRGLWMDLHQIPRVIVRVEVHEKDQASFKGL
ncbi:hypothetical protein BC938DRAFT_476184 [Jimgerdemannia flammicorona]|uniref:Uncharacterized protein n=1 Tax=Jimgerdemannia flammicorona TaxID=994334 RepID=A0A433PJE4_9FUNG|nr:hypothetical protein BC938DRAFT_476184 [Jimgerdemannia flammicorona]